ncbi:MAG TPA: thymidine phosphorylase [Euryarchaeota archaeon]|nr:thymidine phosphorylase [Euryarchaeota archaeon]
MERHKEKMEMLTFKADVKDIDSGEFFVTLNNKDAEEMGLLEHDRVKVSKEGKSITAIVQKSMSLVKPHNVTILTRGAMALDVKNGDDVLISPTGKPRSVGIIKAKMDGKTLTSEEMRIVVNDIVERRLSYIELTAYVVANYINGMNMQEIKDLTLAMVETGETIDFATGPIFDFHSVGGSPGNKVTLIVVPIIMAAGLIIPKTSSRAISSACGTADILETICNVTLSTEEIKSITQKIGGTIAWGGGVELAPADDLIIHVEYPLGIDPYGQLLASVMAKKKAVGANYMLLDIPMGPGTKVPDEKLARRYARDFIELGEMLGIKVECAITYGGQPVGHGIGPAIEAREALAILEGSTTPNSVVMKSTHLAGIILEMAGLTNRGQEMAMDILRSGKALEKFRLILKHQCWISITGRIFEPAWT